MTGTFDLSLLTAYHRKFIKLRRATTDYGKAPHKPVFLLTVLELIEKQIVCDNRVLITPELVATFKENFALLVRTAHKDDFTQPFYYLQNDGIWFLKAKTGTLIDNYIRSVQTLNDLLDYGYFNDDLYRLLQNDYARLYLKNGLLDHYFSDTKAEFQNIKNPGCSYLSDLNTYLLNEREMP